MGWNFPEDIGNVLSENSVGLGKKFRIKRRLG